MEKILFRALGVSGAKKDKWCFGYYQKSPSLRYGNIVAYEGFGSLSYHNVNENTVGQFIGLMDVNKKEVFDGDILSVKLPDTPHWKGETIMGVVEYDNVACSFVINQWNKGNGAWHYHYFNEDFTITVIGNVYEHSEKLKNT